MKDTTYNGWTNYATWRVNLEMCDGLSLDDFSNNEADFDPSLVCVHTLADALKERAEYYLEVEMEGREGTFVESYARAFLDDVNWAEIARYMVEEATL